jgi:3-oxo-5-alpha-steroid 4-dehydrogenase 1
MPLEIYNYLLYTWLAVGLITFLVLLRKTAPYGRHTVETWGPMIPNQLGWMLMEGFAPFLISLWFWTGTLQKTNTSYFFYGLYMAHYIYRSYIFPFLTNTRGKKMPLVITGSAIGFNICNTFILGYYLGNIGGNYPDSYFLSPVFILGFITFLTGVFINVKSDFMLMNLREPGETGYKIPKGFLFDYISCPNLFGEMVEWIGFGIMINSLPAYSFPIWTIVNLLPRALDHHKWYLQKFVDYPKERKAVVPGIL